MIPLRNAASDILWAMREFKRFHYTEIEDGKFWADFLDVIDKLDEVANERPGT